VIDHFGFRVKDLKAARRFYDATMKALGLGVIDNTDTSFLVGRSSDEPIPFLWIGTDQPDFWKAGNMTSASPIHVSFQARDAKSVDAFHRTALENGGSDNGQPGPRGPKEMGYYAAYVIDPDGNNIEAAFRKPPA
jgi:catechol 2,3-dioxygenase-like lactoylglutathione lyase family enzyme